jgi:outer membrane protein OmpA-like peptidoglycan-associated protein
MRSRTFKSLCLGIASLFVAIMPVGLVAQSPATAARNDAADSASKWDIFAGYSYLAPKGTVDIPQTQGPTVGYDYNAVNVGGLFSVARFFSPYFGLQGEYGFHEWGKENPPTGNIGTQGNNDGFQTLAVGPIFRFPTGSMTPFIHGLVGAALINGPYHNPDTWGPELTAGGGLDYETPLFNHHLAIRVFQADYEYMHASFGPQPEPPGGRANINAVRLSAGLVFHAGTQAPPAPITISCAASPSTVFPGDPVTVTATPGMLNPKLHSIYSWSGDEVSGSETTAHVNTASLAPGTYTVKCGVKEGKPGKEGLKPWQTADGTATYTVKQFEPPTISCAASPSTVKPGEAATITASGMSPQNRPLTYSYSAASGSVEGTGATATFNSNGAPAGTVEVTCRVSDDKNQTATANTMVTVEAPPPVEPAEQKQLETRLALHSVFFPTDQPKAAHPEGGLVASQERTLTTLSTDFKKYLEYRPNAHLTLTGHADARGSVEYNKALSDRRVARTKQFLVEQGVPEASIETRALGKEQNLSADEVKAMVEQNSELSAAERDRILGKLRVIVWAQNRRVDISLSTTGQESVRQFPFNAADSLTLLDQKAPARKKAAGAPKR